MGTELVKVSEVITVVVEQPTLPVLLERLARHPRAACRTPGFERPLAVHGWVSAGPRAHPGVGGGQWVSTFRDRKNPLDSSRTPGDLTAPFRTAQTAFQVTRNGSKPLQLTGHLGNVG